MRVVVLSLACFLAVAGAAAAEDWQPSPGEAGLYFDKAYLKVDKASGLVIGRVAEGKPRGAGYKDWPSSKGPIMLYALDCEADKFMTVGLDMTGAGGLEKNWRKEEKVEDISGGAGHWGKEACKDKATLPVVVVP
jgi:hypothetical protein